MERCEEEDDRRRRGVERRRRVLERRRRGLERRRRHHITPVLSSLHWLPVCIRIDYKILLITFKARRGQALEYITDMLTPYQPVHSLRTAGEALLTVSRSRLKTRGDRAFSVRAARPAR